MIALLQRVTSAAVAVEGATIASIGAGLLAFVCAERGDNDERAVALATKVAALRMFSDENGKMNRNIVQTGGALLAVSQFTLAAQTHPGNRPGFSDAAPPDEALRLFEHFVAASREAISDVQTGRFGADMAVSLINDGPVTFWIRVPARDRGHL